MPLRNITKSRVVTQRDNMAHHRVNTRHREDSIHPLEVSTHHPPEVSTLPQVGILNKDTLQESHHNHSTDKLHTTQQW